MSGSNAVVDPQGNVVLRYTSNANGISSNTCLYTWWCPCFSCGVYIPDHETDILTWRAHNSEVLGTLTLPWWTGLIPSERSNYILGAWLVEQRVMYLRYTQATKSPINKCNILGLHTDHTRNGTDMWWQLIIQSTHHLFTLKVLKGFIQFEIITNVLVSSFWFIWIPMLWVYGHYKYFYSYSMGINFRRMNLTAAYVRFSRL